MYQLVLNLTKICFLFVDYVINSKKYFYSVLKKTLSSEGFEPTPTKVKQNGDERIYFLQKKYFQMQFFLILRIAIHTPPIQNERSYPNLFKKAGPKYLLVPALYEIFIWKQPFYYINFPENDFCVGTHWLQTPILNSFWGRNLQIFEFYH